MKRLLQPHFIIIGAVALALLGWSTVSAATGARSHHVVVREVSVQTATEAEHQTPAPTAGQPSPTAEPAENEPAENENEAAENENEAAEPAEDEPNEVENENENPAPPTAAPTAATSTRTFNLVGGTVTLTCTNNSISLNSAVPATGFQVETETEDGGQEFEVKFESSTHKSEIKASCVGGQVQANEIQEESS